MNMLTDLEVWWFVHRRDRAYVVLAAALALVLSGVVVWAFSRNRGPAGPAKVLAARAAGEYDRARRLLAAGLKRDPANRDLIRIQSELLDLLDVDFRMRVTSRAAKARASAGEATLGPADGYHFTVRPSAACYLYMFQLGDPAGARELFHGRAAGDGALRIPAEGWLHLRPGSAGERVFLVAARWEIPALERLAAQANHRDGLKRLLERLSREDWSTDRLPGLVFGKIQLRNLDARAPRRS
jgi:hypothetical protein